MSDYLSHAANLAKDTLAANATILVTFVIGFTCNATYNNYNTMATKVEEKDTKEIVEKEASTKEETEATTTKVEEEALATKEIVNEETAPDGDNQLSTNSVHTAVEELVDEGTKAETERIEKQRLKNLKRRERDRRQRQMKMMKKAAAAAASSDTNVPDTSVPIVSSNIHVVPSSPPTADGFITHTNRRTRWNPYGKGNLQGRLLKSRMLPSTDKNEDDGKPPYYYEAHVRVLVEMGNTLLVVPEALASGEELKEWQNMLCRHEVIERNAIEFQNESCWDKKKCVKKMIKILKKLINLKIQYMPMPHFDEDGVVSGKFVNRPCVVLYGDEGQAQLYLTLFMGTPKEHHSKKEACGTKVIFDLNVGEGPEDLQPLHCTVNGKQFKNPHETSILDCTKIAGLPQYKYKQGIYLTKIAEPFYVCKKGIQEADLLPEHALRPVNKDKLRETIVKALTTLTDCNPFGNYVDTTNQYNVGQIVQYKKIDEYGNIVNCREEFTAPRKMYVGPPQWDIPPPLVTNLSFTTQVDQTVDPTTPTNTARTGFNAVTP